MSGAIARSAVCTPTSLSEEKIVNGVVYGRINQMGTTTTRCSSDNPNVQQIPAKLRHVFGKVEGFKVVKGDWSQLELRLGANHTTDVNFIKVLQETDIHAYNAARMFGSNFTSEDRDHAKPGSFGWIFAGGTGAIISQGRKYGFEISEYDAQLMLDTLNELFPVVAAWHKAMREVSNRNYSVNLKLLWGHQRFLSRKLGTLRSVSRSVTPPSKPRLLWV